MGPGMTSSAAAWSLRWQIDSIGKEPGQIRCAKDVCITRGDGNFVAVTDSLNARVQMFSVNSGRLLAVLGVDSSDSRTSKSFSRYSQRRMKPVGVCETADSSLLVVTDQNRLLYIDTSSLHGQLQAELILTDKQHLSGVAVTRSNKLIVTETGIHPSVGLYESNGKLIRQFKDDFRSPAYVAWNDEYEIAAVADGEQQCVTLYDRSGQTLNRFGRLSSGKHRGGGIEVALSYPAGVSWASDTTLLVADRADHRVLAFDIRNCAVEDRLTQADGLRNPVSVGSNRRDRIVLTEEFYDFGVDKYQVKMFRLRPTNGSPSS